MNIAKQFAALLNKRQSLAIVVADRGDGTAEVTGADGGSYVVNLAGASVVAADRLVVEGGNAVAKAPALPEYSISV